MSSPSSDKLAVLIDADNARASIAHELARENGWATLSAVGSFVVKNSPSFDPRNYGCQKLGELVRQQPYLEVKEVPVNDGSTNVHLYVRFRQPQA